MNNYLYIVNPTSGKGRGTKVKPLIEDICINNNSKYKIIETKYRLHATEIVKEEKSKFSHIISVGGDGTLNEVINGIINSDIILGVLPVGSGNDFVKNIKLGNSIKDNISIFNENNYTTKKVDVWKVVFKEEFAIEYKEHYFINNLGIGFDAYVGKLNQQNKLVGGITSYIYSVFKALINYRMIDTEIEINNSTIIGERLMISIGNGISSGGGFYLNPHAKINDGLLNISIFDKISRTRLLTALPLALLNKIDTVPEAKQYVDRNMKIKLNTPYFAHCDGEIISDKVKEVEITLAEQQIRVMSKKEV